MKKLCILSLFTLFVVAACNKNKDESNAPSLAGKWTVENNVYKEYTGGSLSKTYTAPGAGAVMDFQDNGHVVITYPGYPIESLSYAIKHDSKVDIDGDIFEIRDLTASKVSLFLRQDYAPGDYDELYINLKR
jgi:hypothetical protein